MSVKLIVRPTSNVDGAVKRASVRGRAASQFVVVRSGRKVRGKTHQGINVRTSWPTNSK